MEMISRIPRAILFTLVLAATFFVFLQATGTLAQKPKEEARSTTTWEQSDDGLKMRVEIRGKAEFTDDYTDIRDVSEGGFVRIEEDRYGQSRRYEVRRNSNGELRRTYYLNGDVHPLDREAQNWLAKIVLNAVRQSGIDADKRVQTILRQRGLTGVLGEIALISSDYAKGIYFKTLIKNGNLNAAALQSVLREAARQISSDYEQAQLLIGVAPVLTGKEGALTAFFEAVATIKSDYEHKRVLAALLKDSTPGREVLIQIARSAARMSSDYEKANVLKSVAAEYLDDRELRAVFFQTVATIESDYEHRGILSALLQNNKPSEEVLSGMLNSISRMSSDYEKATFLLEASRVYAGDTRLKESFLKAVETIKSDYERGRVLSALIKNKQIG
jgi:hypothetical protein